MSVKKVGLALGGGAARGLAHIGVLEVLEDAGIPIDMIAGTSVGAIIGALYARGKSAAWIKDLALDLAGKKENFFRELSLSKTGLIQGRKLEKTLKPIFGNITFEELKYRFACAATDVYTGEEVVFNDGPVWDCIRASASIPLLLTVAKWKGRYLVDGGLTDPVPAGVAREMGAELVIAVNVIPAKSVQEEKEPNVFAVAMQLVYVLNHQLVKSSIVDADIIIEPQVEHIGFADFHRAEECIHLGKVAALQALPSIEKCLKAGD